MTKRVQLTSLIDQNGFTASPALVNNYFKYSKRLALMAENFAPRNHFPNKMRRLIPLRLYLAVFISTNENLLAG